MTTKEQEREALEQIRAILSTLDQDGYVCTALEGCMETAAQNIENDWACSMKQRAESLEAENVALKATVRSKNEILNHMELQVQTLQEKQVSGQDLSRCLSLLESRRGHLEELAAKAGKEIIRHAENPQSAAFLSAVNDNRNAAAEAEELATLAERIRKAI